MRDVISDGLGRGMPTSMFRMSDDNGMSTPFDCDADCEDIVLSAGRKKRPDASWRLRSDRLPNPPTWLALDAENVPNASIVLEVAVVRHTFGRTHQYNYG